MTTLTAIVIVIGAPNGPWRGAEGAAVSTPLCLFLTLSPGRWHCYPHFTGEQTEVQREGK